MTYPLFAEIQTSYTAFQQAQGDNSFPGTSLDVDLANLARAIDALNAWTRGVTRADGELGNQTVGAEQLKSELVIGIKPPTAWAPDYVYAAGDTVFATAGYDLATVDHTSAATFDVDLAAGRWVILIDFLPFFGGLGALQAAANLADLEDAPTARNNLGLPGAFLEIDGGQFTAGDRRIKGVADPVDAQDAVTKAWALGGFLPFVSPTWFGASPSATAEENTAALVLAHATGKEIVWPAGLFKLDPVEFTLASSQSFRMRGHSQGGTRFIMESGGIKINTPADRNVLRPEAMSVDFSYLTFLAGEAAVNYAIWINWPTWSSITIGEGVVSTMGRSQKHRIANCSFGSETSTDTWVAGIRLSCVSDILIDDCIFTSQQATGSAILFDRLDQTKLVKGTNNKVRHCTVQGWDKGIEHIAPGEGLLVDTCSFVSNYGVYAWWDAEEGDTGNPQVQVIGGHVNVNVCGFFCRNFGDLHIANVLIYTRPNAKGIYITCTDAPNKARGISVTNNIFRIPSGSASNNIAIELGAQIGLTYVHGNILSGYTASSIHLSTGTKGVAGANIGYNCAAVTNLGESNTLTLAAVTI